MILRLAISALAVLLLACPVTAGKAVALEPTGFLDAVEDMPLMTGLKETGDGGIVFDKPNGRIVRALAKGHVKPDDVRNFYIRTLPQLGWSRAAKLELFADLLIFRREGEKLQIQTVPASESETEVRFSIEPY